ncbi:WD domain, G-beta repeat protein [Ancylostoma ceylanicum]|uniref:WD repeat domain-containing protein 83 n=1 Tax=Ancylostoma ceylanicum TaxID=53326 RepID=A0A0D6M6C6_9BILA|nr:WD domain, G-beta repeat protein [Ancylostoma ceylanicum]
MSKGAPTERARVIDCRQDAVRAVRYNVDGNYCLTCGSDKTVKLWNPIKGSLLKTYAGTGNEIFNEATDSVLSIDINGGEIVAGSADCNYRLYSIREGNVNIDFMGESVNSVHFTPDGNCVLASTQDGSLRLMDKMSGKMLASLLDSNVLAKLEHPSKVVHSLSPHPKKQHLLTAAGQLVYLWVSKNDEDFEC